VLLREHLLDLVHCRRAGQLNRLRVSVLNLKFSHQIILLLLELIDEAFLHLLLDLLHPSKILHLDLETQLCLIEGWNNLAEYLHILQEGVTVVLGLPFDVLAGSFIPFGNNFVDELDQYRNLGGLSLTLQSVKDLEQEFLGGASLVRLHL
jgi:hypothetical protein